MPNAGAAGFLTFCQKLLRGKDTAASGEPSTARRYPGLEGLELPILPADKLNVWAGEFSLNVIIRNLSGTDYDFRSMLRSTAARAAANGKPVETLELTTGDPRLALGLTDESYVRAQGDMLIYDNSAHAAPKLKATVITPLDRIRDFLTGPAESTGSEHELQVVLASKTWKPSKAEMLAGYEERLADGTFDMRVGEPITQLKALLKEGKRFDFIFTQELAWTKNRVQMLELLPNLLTSGGVAYLPLEWWRPGMERGMEKFEHFADTVELPGGRHKPLADYLAQTYPELFTIAHFPGATTLVVKSAQKPINLGFVDAAPTGKTIRNGLPTFRWLLKP